MASDQGEKDRRALELVKAGVSIEEVAERLHFRSTTSAQAAVDRALKRSGTYRDDISSARQLDLERIERMYRAFYPKALRGDERAAETILKLMAERARLLSQPKPGRLAAAFEKTVASMTPKDLDSAIVASGLRIAEQIDFAQEHGTSLEVTKALYLVPHFVAVLRELNATPAVRKNLAGTVGPTPDEEPEDELDSFKRRGKRTKAA